MAGWSGFSDADLRAIKGEKQKEPDNGLPVSQRHSQAASSRGKPISRRLQYQPPASQTVPKGAMLSKPQVNKSELNINCGNRIAGSNKKDTTGPGITNVNKDNAGSKPGDKTAASGEGVKERDGEEKAKHEEEKEDEDFSEDDILSREIENLEVFRKHQKRIEDLNIKKKHELAAAIQQRQKQAKAETSKLVAMQQELAKLNQMVNNDVSVLRDKIEESSREYLEAQKRYDRAEKEFIESKMELHRKEENKENLTDHLYAIIHQNEVRKAKKLTELMEKLNMEDEETNQELKEIAHLEVPQITMINPVTHVNPKKHGLSESEKEGSETPGDSEQGGVSSQGSKDKDSESGVSTQGSKDAEKASVPGHECVADASNHGNEVDKSESTEVSNEDKPNSITADRADTDCSNTS